MTQTVSVSRPNVHIVGLAGSGKTTLACWLADHLKLERHDLDWIVYDNDGERRTAEIEQRIETLMGFDGWVTEGAYGEPWLGPLLEGADRIVWLDVALTRCLFRMVKRHVAAELRRSNKHPGWRRLFRFMNYTRDSADDQRRRTAELLAPHHEKVRRCRSSRDVVAVKELLLAQAAPAVADYGGTTTKSSNS
jgi:adenylate kinase family enzyme